MNQDLRRMAEEAAQVPLVEQLASVPETARLVIDDADGKGTHYIPVGRMCKEAAAALTKLAQGQEQEWVAVVENLNGNNARAIMDCDGRYLPTGAKLFTHPIPSQQEERKSAEVKQARRDTRSAFDTLPDDYETGDY